MQQPLAQPKLRPNALVPLPLGQIRPTGWLLAQLKLQAEGLSGHLDEVWPDVADSAWIGGGAEGWERGPYWLDGFVPLAFLLDDERLIAKARRWVDVILERQTAEGWLGPVRDTSDAHRKTYDPWPVFVVLKALAQFYEATGDPRIIPAMLRFLRFLGGLLEQQPLFDWGRYRWADLAVTIHWLFERTGEAWLLELAAVAYHQSFDWRRHFDHFPYLEKQQAEQIHPPAPTEPRVTFRTDLASHVVNNAMAIKQPGVWLRQSLDLGDQTAVFQMIETLDRYHGQVTGVFTGDEHLAGLSPSQGTELCAVVEYMFSLETLLPILGDVALADRLERITFNALPATLAPDMWTHQYVQQANQVLCAISHDRVYTNNGPDANIFGLEPHYGCCTANFHQGWPKFAASLWMQIPDRGLAALSYAPCQVVTSVQQQPIRLWVETAYPFGETIRIVVEPEAPIRFALHLRIPAWAEGATLTIGDGDGEVAAPGTLHCVEHEWNKRTEVVLRLPMQPRVTYRPSGGVVIERGPLVYALNVGAEWRPVPPHTRSAPTQDERVQYDYEVHPTTPWNYALALDPDDPESWLTFEQRSLGERPFSPDRAPVVARVHGRQIPGWDIERGAAGPVPTSPVGSDEPLEELELIPYGCTVLRVTEFPVLTETDRDASGQGGR